MDKKLYYDDPLAAAYMAREFGVMVLIENIKYQPDNGEDPSVWTKDYQKILEDSTEGCSIHPASYHIFEPQKDDMINDQAGQGVYCGESNLRECKELVARNICKIIQRNNKPFFWPEVQDG